MADHSNVSFADFSQGTYRAAIVATAQCFFNGFCVSFGNLLLICIIYSDKKLRSNKSFIVFGGLCFGSFIQGVALLSGGSRRLQLLIKDAVFVLVTPWYCMKEVHNWFFYIGNQISSFMLVAVSVDRFMAVKWPLHYMALGKRYGYTVVTVGAAYGFLTMPLIVSLSAFGSSEETGQLAMCFTTIVGPPWFGYYLPMVEWLGGVLSILIFVMTWMIHKKHTATHQETSVNQKNQAKLTRTVGWTVLVTFFVFVIPQATIIIMRYTAPNMPSILNPYAWAISNSNSSWYLVIMAVQNAQINAIVRKWLRIGGNQVGGVSGAASASRRSRSNTGKDRQATNF